jgi:hypothetical protein
VSRRGVELVLRSPGTGVFRPASCSEVTCEGEVVERGSVVGTIDGSALRSPGDGWVVERLAEVATVAEGDVLLRLLSF